MRQRLLWLALLAALASAPAAAAENFPTRPITVSSPEEAKAMLADEVKKTASLVQILNLRQP
jgi:hypothetical protein